MSVKAIIFDLDGVLVSTDRLHFLAWKKLAEEEGIPFTEEDNLRQRGVSRMESLEILLEKAFRSYTDSQKLEMAERKNSYYRSSLVFLTPDDVLPGAVETLKSARLAGLKVAVGSSSRNAKDILARTGLTELLDAVADGNDIQRSKPDPQVFLTAAERLGIEPGCCLVVEDAASGIEAAKAAGMIAVAVGAALGNPMADINAMSLYEVKRNQFGKSCN